MEVTVLNRQRGYRVPSRDLVAFLERLTHEQRAAGASSLAVCLVSDRRMREYNLKFRGCDATTDVLAFQADRTPGLEGERPLGDIVISVATARRQALQARHPLGRELKILALHGYLHLLGYDHATDDGHMRRLERRLARRLLPGTTVGIAG